MWPYVKIRSLQIQSINMGSYQSRLGTLSNVTGVLTWKHTERGHRERTAMWRVGTEIEIMLPQANELLGYQKLLEARKDLLLKVLKTSLVSWHLDFWTLGSRTMHRINLCCLQPLKYVVLSYSSPRELIYMASALEVRIIISHYVTGNQSFQVLRAWNQLKKVFTTA